MNFHAQNTLHEAEVSIEAARNEYTRCNSMTQPGCQALFTGVEQAIKAPIYENYGSIPSSFHNHNLRNLCEETGLWAAMPEDKKTLVRSISVLGPGTRYVDTTEFATLANSISAMDWDLHLKAADGFPQFIRSWITSQDGETSLP